MKKAIEKLKSEMTQNNTNPYIQVVGEFLLGHLNANPESEGKILAADKTIGKSLNEMRKDAEKKKVGNYAVLTDQEGFAVVLRYFGIDAVTPTISAASTPKPSLVEIKPISDSFDIKLEDLL